MELQSIIAAILAKHIAIICSRVRARWDGQSGIQGLSKIDSDLPSIIGGIVTASISASGSKAWQCEFGRGSMMAKTTAENPYLPQFFENTANGWNPMRRGYSIRGRAAGSYTDLDGVSHESSGSMAGLNLERNIGAKDAMFQPLKPQFIIKEEMERGIPELVIAVQSAVAGYTIQSLTMQSEIYL